MEELTPAQFSMLTSIAEQPRSASDIAKATTISLPYILNQLALLEARGYVQKEIIQKQSGPGKPKKQYSLTSAMATISVLREGFGKKITANNLTKTFAVYLQMLTIVSEKNRAAFSEYYWTSIAHLEHIRAIAFIKEENNEVELLAIAQTKHLDELRKSISSYIIKQKEYKGLRVGCWINSPEEFIHGIKNHDKYYIRLLEQASILADPYNEFAHIKKEVGQ
jgi:predicted transcriptional regulator